MDPIAFDRLDHVGAGVHDLDVAAAWWRDHFGFVRETDFTLPETGARGAFLRRGDIRIELFEYPDQGTVPQKRKDPVEALREGGFHHVAFQVDDVAAAVAELERRGVDIAYPLSDGPFGTYAIVSDPSGNFVELFPKTDVRDPRTSKRAFMGEAAAASADQGTGHLSIRPMPPASYLGYEPRA